jgi:carbonic anhydrase
MTLAPGVADAAEASTTREERPPRTPAESLQRLMKGNANFVKGKLTRVHAIKERRQDVVGGQKPFAIILTCADSRVPPEHIFDQTLGHIFVCRVAGNILQPAIVGSIEYSVVTFGSHLIMVLGHHDCGAVKDTIKLVEKGGKAPGSIQTIVEAITPAVKATPRRGRGDKPYIDAVVKTNALLVARSIPQRSQIVSRAVSSRKLRIVAADYSLTSGRVKLL